MLKYLTNSVLIKPFSTKSISSFCLIILFSLNIHAQTEERFEHITRNDGLSHANVYSIIQDKYGFLWFGTQDGLNRYNGYNFQKFYHESSNSNSLISSSFGKIYEDSKGYLWLGTYASGLDRYDPLKKTFKHYLHDEDDPSTISSNRIRCIKESPDGYIWVATAGGGVNKLDPITDEFTHFKNKPDDLNSLSDNNVNSMVFDQTGNLWIGTGVGLDYLDTKTNTFSSYELGRESFDDNKKLPVRKVIIDRYGILWIGTTDGLFVLDDETNEIREYNHSLTANNCLSSGYINTILEDSEGTIWVGTENGGLNKYIRKKDSFEHYVNDVSDPYSISSNRIWSLFEDESKILWIGTKSGGLNKLDLKRKKFHSLQFKAGANMGLPYPSISALTGDTSGRIWIGTDGGGLCSWLPKTNQFTYFRSNLFNKNSLSDDEIWSICTDSKNRIWAGTHSGGVDMIEFKHDKYQITNFLHDSKDSATISNNQINAVFEDKTGHIWLATRNGLNELIENYNTGGFTIKKFQNNYSDTNSLTDNYITSIYQDHYGNVWAGTYSEGLNMIDKKNNTITHFRSEPGNTQSISSSSITVIFEDHLGVLWIGTSDGLNRFDLAKKTFHRYYRDSGLPSNEIMGVREDNSGNLWISTTNGLSKFDPFTEVFINFDISDGLINDGFNWNATYKDATGRLYFGTTSGLVSFTPDEITMNSYLPPVVITSLRTLKNKVWVNTGNFVSAKQKEKTKLELNYNNNIFTIEFAAFDYTDPKENSFEYKIEGLDENWINYGTNHSLTVTNLDPGEYIFRVRATNSDKLLNKKGVAVSIIVKPPFWRTRAFMFMAIVLVMLAAISVYSFLVKLKTNKILEEKNHELKVANSQLTESQKNLKVLNETKDKFFSIIAHDLRNPFNPLLSLTELLYEDYDLLDEKERREFIKDIRDGAKRLYDLLENLLQWSLSQTKRHEFSQARIEMSKLINKNIELLKINADKKKIRLINKVEPNTLILADDNMMNSIVRNLINNAIKFSPENSTITVDVKEINSEYEFVVHDEGIGIKPEFIDKMFDFGFSKTKINKSKEKGSGLGLILCKEFVEQNNGKIRVESKVGKGSSFYFTAQKIE